MAHREHDESRRAFLAAMMATVAAGCGSGGGDSEDPGDGGGGGGQPTTLRMDFAGCYSPAMSGYGASQMGCGVSTTFGDTWFDQRFITEAANQASFFRRNPTLWVLDECSVTQANAFSSPQQFILFGKYLVQKLILETQSELPIAGVLAHEWAHQLQFAGGWMVQTEPTQRRSELEADAWSGLYMSLFKAYQGADLDSYFQTVFRMGDYNFNHPGHHGTPRQRLAAAATGLELAIHILSTDATLTFQEAHNLFVVEIDRIINTIAGLSAPSMEASALVESMSPQAGMLLSRMNHRWIERVATGKGRLSDAPLLPKVPLAVRQNLFPY